MPIPLIPVVAKALSGKVVIGIIQLIMEEAPAGIAAIRALLNKKEATPADFADAIAQYNKDTFEALAPDAAELIRKSDAAGQT